MILTKDVIKECIRTKKIKISPFSQANIGPASVDLTLSDTFWVYEDVSSIVIREDVDFKRYTKRKRLKEITLQPGEFVLGITREKITLAPDICGLLTGRSRFARMGILVHATATFVQPGVSNHQVLEIKNVSHNALTLKPELKIAQIVFLSTSGKAMYAGKFKQQ